MQENRLREALETMNQRETAEHFGVHLATVKRAIKRYGIKYSKKSGGHYLYRDNPLDSDLELTDQQRDIITGSLLGDGFLLATDIFRIKQKKSRKEYVDCLHKELSPFTTPVRVDRSRKPTRLPDGTVSHKLEHWKGGYTWSASFSTRKHKVFEELRRKWYPDGEKRLPDDLELNPTIVTHWYLQDGNHNKQRNYYKLSTQSFTKTEVETLSQKLNDMLSINSDVQIWEGKPVVIITKTNGEDAFSEVIQEGVSVSCFDYKL